MKPKIAFISNVESVPWGGSEELWSQSARRLLKEGAAIAANVKRWPDVHKRVAELISAGCDVSFRGSGRVERVMRRFRGDGGAAWIRRLNVDLLVICLGANTGCGGWAQAAREAGIPYVIIAQAAGEIYWPEAASLDLEIEGYANAKAAYFVSRHNLELTSRQLALKLDHAKVVANPFQSAGSFPLAWPVEDGGLRLACVGRLEPAAKGQDLIFQVLAQDVWRNRDIHVTLFGSGPFQQYFERLIQIHQLKNISLGGFVGSVSTVWNANHALLLPSRVEGLPLVVVEAMYWGRPCIATAVGGNTEVIEDGLTGFIVPWPAADVLGECLERVWAKRGELATMGQAAAAAIRRLIPADPVAEFVAELRRQAGHARV